MVKRKRVDLAVEAHRMNLEQLARLGGELKNSRALRRMTQAQVAASVGLARSSVSAAERGWGGGLTVDTWQRLGLAVGRRLTVDIGGDPKREPADAGHLAIQELVLRLGRAAGYRASFELPTRPSEPARSADVGLRDDRRRLLIVIECWNTIGDVGAAARSMNRKLAEAEAMAVAIGGDRPHRVSGCWVVRATTRNRALVRRYPQVFSARLPGSSAGWARAIVDGNDPPAEPGLVWCDVGSLRLFAWRQRA